MLNSLEMLTILDIISKAIARETLKAMLVDDKDSNKVAIQRVNRIIEAYHNFKLINKQIQGE